MISEKAVFLLAIEPGQRPPLSTSNVLGSLIDICVRTFQPAPVLMHVEMFVAPRANEPLDNCMFATYYGDISGWGEDKPGSKSWYVGGKNRWRAVPMSVDADVVRQVCENETDAPYSVCMYIPSVFPFRFLAGLVRARPKGWAHCASLSARIMKAAGFELNHSAAWYSPSTLWSEVVPSSGSYIVDHAWMLKHGCQHAATLTLGSNDAVEAMSDDQCRSGIAYLANEVRSSPKDADLQRKLASGILRYAITNRGRE